MKEIKVTNLVKFYTLLLLYKNPIHGYELIRKLELCTGKKISASHVYPFLSLLEKNNLIELKIKGDREKKEYQLSKKGKLFTSNLIERFSKIVSFNINQNIKECVNCGCKLIEGEYKKKIKNKIFYFCCKFCAKNYKS